MNNQIEAIENLKSIKGYYSDLTEFLVEQQNKSRGNRLEAEFAKELEYFLTFWQNIFNEFNKVSEQEVENILKNNKRLKKDFYDILEKVVGFRPPPDKLFLDLVAMRKIAIKLRNNDAVKFLNFDYFKKHNKNINEKWVRDRRQFILTRMRAFEEQMKKAVAKLKYKLNQELWRLQAKRAKQFDHLTVKYIKCKNLVSEINSQEAYELKKLKRAFLVRNDVPWIKIPKEIDNTNILSELDNEQVEAPRRVQEIEEEEEVVEEVKKVVTKKSKTKKTTKKETVVTSKGKRRNESTESVRTLEKQKPSKKKIRAK